MKYFNHLVLCYKRGYNIFVAWTELTKDQRLEVINYLGVELSWYQVLEKIKSS